MKAIINDKLFDTEKAKAIYAYQTKRKGAKLWFSKELRLIDTYDAMIYATKNNNYFVHLINREYPHTEMIELISECNVKDIIKKLDVDKYIELFGNIAEG